VLRQSRIGSVFNELILGRQLLISQENSFARHPEA
jgi:hypothetical protein